MSEIALLLELSAQGKREDSIVGFFFFTLRQTNRPRSGFENSITEQEHNLDGRWCVFLR